MSIPDSPVIDDSLSLVHSGIWITSLVQVYPIGHVCEHVVREEKSY